MFSLNTTWVSGFYCFCFLRISSLLAGAFQVYKVLITQILTSKQGSEEESNNIDFLEESIYFAIKTAGQKWFLKQRERTECRGSFNVN